MKKCDVVIKSKGVRKQNRGYQGLGKGGNEELLFNGSRLYVWEDKKVLEEDSGDGYTIL